MSFYRLSEQYNAEELQQFCTKWMVYNYQDLVIERKGEEVDEALATHLKKHLKL